MKHQRLLCIRQVPVVSFSKIDEGVSIVCHPPFYQIRIKRKNSSLSHAKLYLGGSEWMLSQVRIPRHYKHRNLNHPKSKLVRNCITHGNHILGSPLQASRLQRNDLHDAVTQFSLGSLIPYHPEIRLKPCLVSATPPSTNPPEPSYVSTPQLNLPYPANIYTFNRN